MARKSKKAADRALGAQQFVSRSQALTKLQLSLADFRRLCILKGIHPREPSHKRKLARGSSQDKAWYAMRDVRALMQEPLVGSIRASKTFDKKHMRLEARREPSRLRTLIANHRPRFDLEPLVRERYPTFDAALDDLDDCLSMLALFASLPAPPKSELAAPGEPGVPERCAALIADFEQIVARAGALAKAFISVKGWYWRCELQGHAVTWVTPHALAASVPGDVDWRILLTFVDFYCAQLKAVNVRLSKQLGAGPDAPVPRKCSLLQGKTVYVAREVPVQSVGFLIACMGGQYVSWSDMLAGDGSDRIADENDGRIDMQVCDRSAAANGRQLVAGRLYVQPQWLVDSLNAGELLLDAVADYAPGSAALPSHVSPFAQEAAVVLPVDPAAAALTPEQKELARSMLTKRQRTVYARIAHSRQRQLRQSPRDTILGAKASPSQLPSQ